jgi:hypothetical protein
MVDAGSCRCGVLTTGGCSLRLLHEQHDFEFNEFAKLSVSWSAQAVEA